MDIFAEMEILNPMEIKKEINNLNLFSQIKSYLNDFCFLPETTTNKDVNFNNKSYKKFINYIFDNSIIKEENIHLFNQFIYLTIIYFDTNYNRKEF